MHQSHYTGDPVSHASCARPGFNLHLHLRLRLHRDLRSLPECWDRHRPREHETAAKEARLVIGQVMAQRGLNTSHN